MDGDVRFADARVLVLGLARSGFAVAQLLAQQGARVTVNDGAQPEKMAADIRVLQEAGIRVVTGSHPQSLLDDCALMVKNPGIPYDQPLVAEALRRGIPVRTEVEVAALLAVSPIIGITGTNGKTTTTSLVGHMFEQAGISAMVAGNIGTPLSAVVQSTGAATWLVTELSSFQLAGTETFHPRVAALLNLTPAHLDYHKTWDEYRNAKRKLFANQSPGDIAVLPADDEDLAALAAEIRADVWWFSLQQAVRPGVFVDEAGMIVFAPPDKPGELVKVMPADEIGLRGRHNLANAVAACAIALASGVTMIGVRGALRAFTGVEHRLEFVREVGGAKWYNDSKATNPVAAIQALSAFSEPLVAILGGLERGDDLSPLLPLLQAKVKVAICLGESGDRMADLARVAHVPHVVRAGSLPEAVALAATYATAGDVVLLSPAAASWDMFSSYEERGRIFKEAVHML
ncbi:MAG: UDP-N-acetylmuramoyl-L-alanine--D-glutamate ligase [Firmicutes bacterium]|nr:UDP-N-acetylmuramoyl-L-alanine--D-glutamate ligase [Bacillota bacterium]